MKRDSKQTGSWSVLKWIFKFIKPYRGWLIFSLIMSAGVIAANLLKAHFIKQLVDHSLEGQFQHVLSVIVVFTLVMIGGSLFSYLAKLATGKFSLYGLRDLREGVAWKLARVELISLGEFQSGDLATRLNNDTNQVHSLVNGTFPNFSVQVLLGLGAGVYILCINWQLFLVSTIYIPFGMLMARFLNKKAGQYYPQSYQAFGAASGEVEQSLLGMEIIKAFTLKGLFSQKIRKRFAEVLAADLKAQKYSAILQPVCYSLANCPRILAIIYGGRLALQGEIGIGTLIGVLQLYDFIAIPTVMMPFVMNRMQQSIAAIDRIAQVMELPEEKMVEFATTERKKELGVEDDLMSSEGQEVTEEKSIEQFSEVDGLKQAKGLEQDGSGEVRSAGVKGAQPNKMARTLREQSAEVLSTHQQVIVFSDVTFGYTEDRPAVQNLNFELQPSQMTALVGASGSGKSTIINLICGLYQTEAGQIRFFGENTLDLNLRSVRQQITVVSQDTYLFPGTIEENIRYGRPNASHDEVVQAAKAAYADEFIWEMADGYATQVGEGGMNLSGGQRQRISIARAFLKDAPILILDEPTSALDPYAERLIQRSIEKLTQGRTVLVIAHRLSTIRQADQILVLDQGRIVERGTHQQLVSQRGAYYRLYNNQFSA